MTVVGGGGIHIAEIQMLDRFKRELSKLDPAIKQRAKETLQKLLHNPRPAGIRFEKLKGYAKPDLYSVHVTGNYKISFSIERIEGKCVATLRRIACHNEIDRHPS